MDKGSDYLRWFPIAVEVEQGKEYLWCGCGESKSPPFCDKEGCAQSVLYKADLTEERSFCNCKHTKNPPWCDGSHAKVLLELIKKRGPINGA